MNFDWPDHQGAFAKIREEIDELERAIESGDKEEQAEELGDLLFAIVNTARHIKVDSEDAMNKAIAKFSSRFKKVEERVIESGREMKECSLEDLDAIWDEIKGQ